MAKIMLNDLAKELVSRHGIGMDAAQLFLTSIVECLHEGIANDGLVKVKGLGTFKLVDVDARESVDVNSGARVVIDSHQKLTFVPDNAMKELVNKPFSQFETVILNEGVDSEMLNQVPEPAEEDEPVAEEPPVEEPVTEEPPAEEPVTEEPPAEEPVAEEHTAEPAAEEPAPEPVAIEETAPEPVAIEETAPDTVAIEETAPDTVAIEEPVVREKPTPVPTEEDEATAEDPKHSYWWAWLLLATAACVLCFAAGYIYGTSIRADDTESVTAKKPATTTTAAAPVVEADTTTAAAPVVEADATAAMTAEKSTTVKAPVAKVKPDEEQPDALWQKYDAMDERVRLGAYAIVGTDYVFTVKEGQTLKGITKATLGEGMECYIEVYNGIKAADGLKPGQELKIPKVELKKKIKKLNFRKLK